MEYEFIEVPELEKFNRTLKKYTSEGWKPSGSVQVRVGDKLNGNTAVFYGILLQLNINNV